jgi:Reverse transcriptase (RNA-dependent DNA polymerase)
MSFLQQRTQFVQLMNSNSNSRVLQAGTPQGTRSGPDDFKLMINCLSFDTDYAKYVDDVTTASVSVDPNDSSSHTASDHLSLWCSENGMILDIQKTKEMLIHLARSSVKNPYHSW